MNLETFNVENLPNQKDRKPYIGVNQASGTLRFNPEAVEKMKLKADNMIWLHHDKENPGDWYLEVVKEKGFVLRKKSVTGPHGLVTQSCKLVRKIFDTIGYTGKSGHIGIGAEPVKEDKKTLWPLITAKLINPAPIITAADKN